MQARSFLLLKLLQEHKIGQGKVPFKETVLFAKRNFVHADPKVRKIALKIFQEIH